MNELRIVVCGTDFGRTYLSALRRRPGFRLAGILARGGERSRRLAERYGVPLYRTTGQLPGDVQAAAVAIGGALNRGDGGRIAVQLLERGVHVLQEHPLDPDELASCLRAARRHRVVYRVGDHYPHLPAVAAFTAAVARLVTSQPVVQIDAQTSYLVLYPLLDVLAGLTGLRPFSVDGPVSGPPMLRALSGVIGGVPLALRVQNEIDPVHRDNGAHLLHRITVYAEGGSLHLHGTDGPVLWTPRFYRPRDYAEVPDVAESADPGLDLPAYAVVGDVPPVAYREVVGGTWPAAVGAGLDEFRAAVLAGADPMPAGQHHLALARMTARIVDLLGPPAMTVTDPPDVAGAHAAVTGR